VVERTAAHAGFARRPALGLRNVSRIYTRRVFHTSPHERNPGARPIRSCRRRSTRPNAGHDPAVPSGNPAGAGSAARHVVAFTILNRDLGPLPSTWLDRLCDAAKPGGRLLPLSQRVMRTLPIKLSSSSGNWLCSPDELIEDGLLQLGDCELAYFPAYFVLRFRQAFKKGPAARNAWDSSAGGAHLCDSSPPLGILQLQAHCSMN